MLKIPDRRIVTLLLAGILALLLATVAQAATIRLSDRPFTAESSDDSRVLYLPNLSVSVDGHGTVATAVAAGASHTCALTDTGGVMCWGRNESGQLGDGTTTNSGTPVVVEGLSGGVSDITAGGIVTEHDGHSCALTDAGGVMCWGSNEYGQLGDGTTTSRSTPVAVTGLSRGVAAVAAGGWHICALTDTGGVLCWGNNFYGQLGNDTTAIYTSTVPVAVESLSSGVAAIAAGDWHTCALTASGGVMCWGSNYFGQLGDGTDTDRNTPMPVTGLGSGVAAIAAGYGHTCVLTDAGGVMCWGRNESGQLGDGTTTDSATPVGVTGLDSGVAAIAAGYGHTCALTDASKVLCWGGNWSGQLGDANPPNPSTAPVAVTGLSGGVAAVSAGGSHTCALTDAGGVLCWGNNEYGQLGDGTMSHRSTPVAETGLDSGMAAVAAGERHTCALTDAGGVLCWGDNGDGRLGDGTTANRLAPVAVTGLSGGVAAVAAGGGHTCALTTGGGVLCWGSNGGGQLGDGTETDHRTPVAVTGLSSGVAAVTAGGSHTCALTTAGGLLCWGYNQWGNLGDGSTTGRSTPVPVVGLENGVAAVIARDRHTCALTDAGAVL